MKFVLIHGAFGSPNENWFPELRADLESLDQTVITPFFSVEDWNETINNGPDVPAKKQSLSNWLNVFEKEVLPQIRKNKKLVFVGHSLGPLFILHIVEKYKLNLDCAIFVSPFLSELERWEFNHVNQTFYKTDFDFDDLKKRIPVSYVLYSDDDPYVSKEKTMEFSHALGSSTILIRRAGHMNSAVNMNKFPLVRDLCYSRLDLSLYQKFLEHHKKQSAQDYITEYKDRGIMKLRPEDVIDEGVFHFRHLQKRGFCTLFTGIGDYWDPNNHYMQKARDAAKRVKDFVRVIVLRKDKDLKNQILKEQVKKDLEAGIKIFQVLWDDIKKVVKEPDFGIWDDDYVCVVRIDPNTNKVFEAELNSRTSDIQIYREWEKYILKKAVPIQNI